MQTTRQVVLAFIRKYIRQNGFAPSMREIGDGAGLSSLSSVSHQLFQLERAGKIRRNPAISRSIVLVETEVDVGEGG